MALQRTDLDKLASLVTAQLSPNNNETQKVKVDFSANGDIIISIDNGGKDKDGIFKPEPLPDTKISKKTGLYDNDDYINRAIQAAITIWIMEMKPKLGDIEWTSQTLS